MQIISVREKRRLAQRLSSPDRPGTLPGPEAKRRTPRKQLGRDRATIGRKLTRNAGRRGYRFRQAHRLATERRSAASEDDPGGAKSRKSWRGVRNGSRGACALRPRSATSGSTSMCGRKLAERCTGRHRGKKRDSRVRGQAGRGSRPRGHRRTSRDRRGEVAGRGLGRRHDRGRPSPGRRAVAGGPRLQVHVAGPARRQDGRGNGRSDAQGPYKEFVPDNGREFAAHREVAGVLEALFCFAQPCRRLNEQRAGSTVQAADFRSPAELGRVENLLNNRPRKALDYRTPAEVFKRGGGDRGTGPSQA